MTDTSVIEGNKLIAEFMGLEHHPSNPDWFRLPYPNGEPAKYAPVAYDCSWNWLMPVVEKIEKEDFGFKMCRKVVEVYRDSTIILKTKKSCRLDSLYLAVVQFITWHNSQKEVHHG